jgi:hypothetical protein
MGMKWLYIALLVSVIIAPFDALYIYIKSEKRKDALKKRRQKATNDENEEEP